MKKLAAWLVTAAAAGSAMVTPVAGAPPARACSVMGNGSNMVVSSAGPWDVCNVCSGQSCSNGNGVWGPAIIGNGCYVAPGIVSCER